MATEQDIQNAVEEQSIRDELANSGIRNAVEEQRISDENAEDDRRGLTLDAGVGVVRAFPGAFEAAFDLVATLDETMMAKILDVVPDIRFGTDPRDPDGGIGFFTLSAPESKIFPLPSIARASEKGFRDILGLLPETERVSGAIAEPIGKFIIGFVTGTKALKGAKLLQGSGRWMRLANAGVAGAVADAAVFDGHEQRLSDFLISFDNKLMNNAVTQYLASDENDSELEGRMKNILEGATLGVLSEVFIAGLRALRVGKKLRTIQTKIADKRKAFKDIEDSIEKDLNTKLDDDILAPEFGDAAIDGASDLPLPIPHNPQLSRFTVESGESGLNVVAKPGIELDSILTLRETDETVTVFFAEIDAAARGQGIGIEMYVEAVEYALARGKILVSDESLTRFARNIYKKLDERGYTVERNLNVSTPDLSIGAPQVTLDGTPMFKVVGKQTTTARRAADDVATAGQRTVRLATDDVVVLDGPRTIGMKSTPEQIFTAILRVGHEGLDRIDIDFSLFGDDPQALSKFMFSVRDAYAKVFRAGNKVPNAVTFLKAKEHLAERLGTKVLKDTYGAVTADDGLAARVVASDQLIINSERSLEALALRSHANPASQSLELALHRQTQIHIVVNAFALGTRSAVAKAMQAMQIMKRHRLFEGLDLSEILSQAGHHGRKGRLAEMILKNRNNPAGLLKISKRSAWGKLRDVLQEFFYGGILSGLSTQIANISGNIFKVLEDVSLRIIGLGVAGLKSLPPGKSFPKERMAEMVGWLAGAKQSVGEAFRFNLEFSIGGVLRTARILKKMTKLERKAFYQEQDDIGNVWKALLTGDSQTGRASKLQEAGQSGFAFNYVVPENLNNAASWLQQGRRGLQHIRAAGTTVIGGIVRLPGKGIVGIDEVFKTLASNTKKYSLAYSDAYHVVSREGGDLGEVATKLLSTNQYEDAGIAFARAQTFQQELGDVGKAVEAFLDKLPVARFIVPFVRTPTNLLKDALSYTPLQLGNRNMYKDIMKGGVSQERAIAKLTLVLGLNTWVWNMWVDERIKGSGSRTNSAALRGIKRYSVRDEDGTWHTFNRLDPIGMTIGFMVDVFDIVDEFVEADHEEMAEEFEQLFSGFLVAFAQNFTSKTYLRGISEFIEVLSQSQRGHTTAIKDYVGTLMASILPLAGSNFERRRASGQDSWARYVFTTLDEFRSRIPAEGFSPGRVLASLVGVTGFDLGNREDLGIRRDVLGRQIRNAVTLTSVTLESRESERKLDLLLADLDFRIPMGGRSIAGIKLSSKQYSEWLLIRGQQVKDLGMILEKRLIKEFDNVLFQIMPTIGKQELISAIVRRYSALARKELLRRDKELAERVREAEELLAAERRPKRFVPSPLPPPQEPEQTGNILFQNVPARGSGERSLIIGNAQRS